MRVRSLEHGWAELEDHGGAQEAQEADPGNINLIHKKNPGSCGSGGMGESGRRFMTHCWIFVDGSVSAGCCEQAPDEARGWKR